MSLSRKSTKGKQPVSEKPTKQSRKDSKESLNKVNSTNGAMVTPMNKRVSSKRFVVQEYEQESDIHRRNLNSNYTTSASAETDIPEVFVSSKTNDIYSELGSSLGLSPTSCSNGSRWAGGVR